MNEERRAGNTEILSELAKLSGKVDNVLDRVADNEKAIAGMMGGVKAGKYIIGVCLTIAAMFGIGAATK